MINQVLSVDDVEGLETVADSAFGDVHETGDASAALAVDQHLRYLVLMLEHWLETYLGNLEILGVCEWLRALKRMRYDTAVDGAAHTYRVRSLELTSERDYLCHC